MRVYMLLLCKKIFNIMTVNYCIRANLQLVQQIVKDVIIVYKHTLTGSKRKSVQMRI